MNKELTFWQRFWFYWGFCPFCKTKTVVRWYWGKAYCSSCGSAWSLKGE